MSYSEIKEILKDCFLFFNFIHNYKVNKKMFSYGAIKIIYRSNEYKILPFDKDGHSIDNLCFYSSNNKNDYIEYSIKNDKKIIEIKSFDKWKFLDKFKVYTKIDFK